jgi:hypothetical protein
MKEIEAWGVTYERYALSKELQNIKRQFSINTVAEMPAHGSKAMPSIYSIGFGMAGAKVTLINGINQYQACWNTLGLGNKVEFREVDNICKTNILSDSYDFVWNFAYLPMEENKEKLIKEMNRISKKFVAFFSVNHGNVGFHIHHTLHKIKKMPWTHGDVHFNKQQNIANFMKRNGLKIVKKGFVDCPVWPDSLGFRDMRLHRENISFDNVEWESPYIDAETKGSFPFWIYLVYLWERLPNFPFFKTLYSHINYVIGQKQDC